MGDWIGAVCKMGKYFSEDWRLVPCGGSGCDIEVW